MGYDHLAHLLNVVRLQRCGMDGLLRAVYFWSFISRARVLDTIHTIFTCIFIYHLTVSNYGQPSSLNQIHWTYVGVEALNTIMAVAVQVPTVSRRVYFQNLMYSTQAFFAYRIMILSGRSCISLISWFICAVRLGMGLRFYPPRCGS